MTGQYKPGIGFEGGDPRLSMARALMQQGSSTAPVQSPLEGIARALQGGLGGYLGGQAKQGQQQGMAAALAALGNQSLDPNARMAAASNAYSNAYPGGDNPLEGMQLSAMMQALLPKAPVSLGKGARLVDPQTGAVKVDAAPDLPQGYRLNKQTGAVEVIPGFETAITGLKRSETTATKQAEADVRLATEPALVAALSGPQASAAAAKAQAGANVDLKMKPAIEAATIQAATPGLVSRAGQAATATTTGNLRGELAPTPGTGGGPDGAPPVSLAQSVAEAKAAPGQPSQVFSRENTLRDEALLQIKRYETVRNAYQKVQDAAKLKTGPGDMGLLYGYIKMLDADSAVREGEYATAGNATSIPEHIRQMYNRAVNGELMEDGVRQKFVQAAGSAYGVERKGYETVVDRYTDLAKRGGLNPENVVRRLPAIGEAKPPNASQSGAPGGAQPVPAVGEVKYGYRFLGGDPGDRSRWEPAP